MTISVVLGSLALMQIFLVMFQGVQGGEITIAEDGEVIEHVHFEYVDGRLVMQPDYHHVGTANTSIHPAHSISKREAEETEESRVGPKCKEKYKQMEEAAKGKPLHLVFSTELDKPLQMQCHYCKAVTDLQVAMLWFKLHRNPAQDGAFELEEVRIAMSDEDNRVTVDVIHTLTISNVVKDDAGTYFCANTDVVNSTETTESGIKKILDEIRKTQMPVFYHVDVILASEDSLREVSTTLEGKKKPYTPTNDTKLNVQTVTVWQHWGPCVPCGEPGVRKRLGMCGFHKLDKEKPTGNFFVDNVLSTYSPAVLCRSTLFEHYPQFKRRKDELEVENCFANCSEFSKTEAMSAAGLGELSFGYDLDTGKPKPGRAPQTIVVEKMVNSKLKIICPGAKAGEAILWLNDTRVLSEATISNQTAGRVEIDVYGALHIHTLLEVDANTYRCEFNGKDHGEVKLVVIVRDVTEIWAKAKWLAYSYVVDLAIFIALSAIKYKYRKVGLRLTDSMLDTLPSSSDSDKKGSGSSGSSSDSGISGSGSGSSGSGSGSSGSGSGSSGSGSGSSDSKSESVEDLITMIPGSSGSSKSSSSSSSSSSGSGSSSGSSGEREGPMGPEGQYDSYAGVDDYSSYPDSQSYPDDQSLAGYYETPSGAYDTTSGAYDTTSGAYDTTSGAYDTTSGAYDTTSGAYESTSYGEDQSGANYGYSSGQQAPYGSTPPYPQ